MRVVLCVVNPNCLSLFALRERVIGSLSLRFSDLEIEAIAAYPGTERAPTPGQPVSVSPWQREPGSGRPAKAARSPRPHTAPRDRSGTPFAHRRGAPGRATGPTDAECPGCCRTSELADLGWFGSTDRGAGMRGGAVWAAQVVAWLPWPGRFPLRAAPSLAATTSPASSDASVVPHWGPPHGHRLKSVRRGGGTGRAGGLGAFGDGPPASLQLMGALR